MAMVDLVESRCHGMFPFRHALDEGLFDKSPRVLKLQQSIERWSPSSDQINNLFKVRGETTLWKRIEDEAGAFDDLSPAIRQILGAEFTPRLCLSFRIREPHVLSQIKGGQPRNWILDLGPAAQKRSGLSSLTLTLLDARLFLFRTGIGILDLSWTYPKSGIDALLEGNYALSHGNHRAKERDFHAVELNLINPHVLQEIASEIIPPFEAKCAELLPERRILYSLARVNAAKDEATDDTTLENEMRLIATRLSHRQTSVYRPNSVLTESSTLAPFPYICHAATIEGGASVVCANDDAPETIRQFLRSGGPNLYVPIYISELHAHLWLLNQAQLLPRRSGRRGGLSENKSLAELGEATVEFRRFFYAPVVSQLSLHNAYHDLWQKALRIPERTRWVEDTADKTAKLLSERRVKLLGIFSGAIGGFLISREIMEALSTSGLPWSLPHLYEWTALLRSPNPEAIEPVLRRVHLWDLATLCVEIAGSIFGCLLSLFFNKRIGAE